MMLSSRDFLVRGLLAGLIAGFIAFGVAYTVGEPSVNAAIAVEEASAPEAGAAEPSEHTHEDGAVGHSHGEEGAAVSRDLQSTLGLLTGAAVYGTVIGGLAGIVSGLALGRFGRAGPRATTLGVAAAGFVVVYAVPYLIYPPNPPAVGSGDTIGRRTGLYFAMLAISLVAAGAATAIGRVLLPRVGSWYASLVAIGSYVVTMVVAIQVMPHYNEVGRDFPAQVLYEFRLGSLLTQVAFWAALAVVLTELVQRLVIRSQHADRRNEESIPALQG